MINLKNKKIIILAAIVFILLMVTLWFLLKSKESYKINQKINGDMPTRAMTDDEKVNVGMDKKQQAEVVNDKEGFFIYNVVK